MSRRHLIQMDHDELVAFLEEHRVVTLATNGHDGWPHTMPLWYVLLGSGPAPGGHNPQPPSEKGLTPLLWSWTYGASQKVRNLERDPRCTLQVEAGHDQYAQLRGVMFRCEAVIHRDVETVAGIGAELAQRYGGGETTPDVLEAMRAQARKRVGLEFHVRKTASWDHRKLGGGY